jgi:asparagine synthase (glutamine-hydrolysing)
VTKIQIQEDNFWKKYSLGSSVIFFKGYLYSHSLLDIVDNLDGNSPEKILKIIDNIDGHYAFVIINNNFTIASVDKIRSTPLFFSKINNSFIIDSNPSRIINNANFVNEFDDEAALELSMSGFTIGDKTIYKELVALKAGEFVIFTKKSYEIYQYFKYFSNTNIQQLDYLESLSDLTIKVFEKMLHSIAGRQIIIPLSAGNDSRLVASALKKLGSTNVICYSYGIQGNFEAQTAKLIAKKLGYKWIFVPLSHQTEREFYASEEYRNYLKFSETCCSVPYIQSLSTIKYLKDRKLIEDDAVFINGNSGDFISGLHLGYLLNDELEVKNVKSRKENILNSIVKKHFSLWGQLLTPSNIEIIKKSLWSEIESQCGKLNKYNDHAFYEYSEFIDRQSKYVISGQRAYEFYGYEWRLPLWDNEYIDYWVKVPAKLKNNQLLYSEMLSKNNFANVWKDEIPVNSKTITPKWVIPLRFFCKVPFALFGKKGKSLWHRFEIIFFFYWMDNTRMMSSISYWRVIKSIWKVPQNHVSWQVKDYLKNHHIK